MIKKGDMSKILHNCWEKYQIIKTEHDNEVAYYYKHWSATDARDKEHELNKIFMEKLNDLQATYRNIINEKMDTVVNELKEIMTTPEDVNIINQLEAFKNGGMIGKIEFSALAEKYNKNYLASRILSEIALKNNIEFHFTPLDALFTLAETIRNKCLNAINDLTNGGFAFAITEKAVDDWTNNLIANNYFSPDNRMAI